MEPGRSETSLAQNYSEPFPTLSWDHPRDYQFIDLVAVLDGAVSQGFISRFDRTISHSYTGWQLWLPGIQGVFELLLKSHTAEALTLRADVVAQYHRTDFLLKYYPDPREKVFETFSLYERILRQSEVFNGQSTPREEVKEKLHETPHPVHSVSLVFRGPGTCGAARRVGGRKSRLSKYLPELPRPKGRWKGSHSPYAKDKTKRLQQVDKQVRGAFIQSH